MNIELLTQSIHSAGLFPIRVEFTHDQSSDMNVLGSLDDYLAAVKALQSPIVFIGTFELTEEQFIYDADDDSIEEDEEIDFRKIQPKLKKFSSRIGETGWFQLAAPMRNGSLTFDIKEEWWIQLHELLDSTQESVEENRNAIQEKIKAEEERHKNAAQKKLQDLINAARKKLQDLIKDEDFQRLKTQKAMREYAINKYPDLEDLNDSDLKKEIQNLAARIEAKSVSRK